MSNGESGAISQKNPPCGKADFLIEYIITPSAIRPPRPLRELVDNYLTIKHTLVYN